MPAVAPDLETAKAEWSRTLLPIGFAASSAVHPAASNVVGVGVGRKISQQKPTEELALKFFVERKLPQSAFRLRRFCRSTSRVSIRMSKKSASSGNIR